MMNEDHLFTLEVDIIQFDEKSDRVIVNGYLGNNLETEYREGKLHLRGNEASISLHISRDDLLKLVQNIDQ